MTLISEPALHTPSGRLRLASTCRDETGLGRLDRISTGECPCRTLTITDEKADIVTDLAYTVAFNFGVPLVLLAEFQA